MAIVKIYATASFYYKRIDDEIQDSRIIIINNFKLFDTAIFPVIPEGNLIELERESAKKGWHWQYSKDIVA
jgi:hypothetical protein